MHDISEVYLDFIEKLPEANKPVVAAMMHELTDRAYRKIGECLKENVSLPEYLQTYVDWIFIDIGADHFTWDNCTKERKETRFEFQ